VSGTGRGPVELSAGCWLVLAGTQWQVDQFEAHTGRVLLRRDDGQELATTVRALVNDRDCRPVPAAAAGLPRSRGRQLAGLEDLTRRQRELVAMRYAHLMEAETGYRSGSPLHAVPGEPRPGYASWSTARRIESGIAVPPTRRRPLYSPRAYPPLYQARFWVSTT
jgi:hypothetical protein